MGKTSLMLRYVQNQFNDKHLTTIQASFLSKRLTVDGVRVNLAIWDTAGQEKFHALGPIYYRDSNGLPPLSLSSFTQQPLFLWTTHTHAMETGAILVYDITDRDSFDRVQNWVKELRKMLGEGIVLVIAGNKCDLERQRVVSLEEAEAYAKTVGAQHFSTSAKLSKGVSELFLQLTKLLLAHSSTAARAGSVPKSDSGTLIITEGNAERDTGSGCSC